MAAQVSEEASESAWELVCQVSAWLWEVQGWAKVLAWPSQSVLQEPELVFAYQPSCMQAAERTTSEAQRPLRGRIADLLCDRTPV